MRIVVAPDSFKDALRANAAAAHIAEGIRSVLPDADIDLCPIADGGEGFIDAVAVGRPGATSTRIGPTADALGRPIEARWLVVNEPGQKPTAVIELAAASGLERLTTAERNPTKTTTFGTGLLMRHAIADTPAEILLGIGGSATTDGGCGIAQALGTQFYDKAGQPIDKPITGGDLPRIACVDCSTLDERLKGCRIRLACDVTNPLTGPNGAAHVYGPQKGATPAQVDQLDAGLCHLARLWREQCGADAEQMPGAGAAGGVGGGLAAMLGAELVPGADLVLDAVRFNERLADADLVITGEGRLDAQSLRGKAAMAVARRAHAAGVPCIALVGCVGEGAEPALRHGLSGFRVIGLGLPAEESIRRCGELLEHAVGRVVCEQGEQK